MSWTDLLPYGLKLIGWLIDRSNLSNEAKRRFMDLVEQAAHEGAIPADLRDRFKRQMDEL